MPQGLPPGLNLFAQVWGADPGGSDLSADVTAWKQALDKGLVPVRVVRGTEFRAWERDKGATAAERWKVSPQQCRTSKSVVQGPGGRSASYASLAAAPGTLVLLLGPSGKLRQGHLEHFVDFHIRYHFERQKEVLIANLELRSLTPDSVEGLDILQQLQPTRLSPVSTIPSAQTSDSQKEIQSRLSTAEELAALIRGHWGIESMHWVLDVVFRGARRDGARGIADEAVVATRFEELVAKIEHDLAVAVAAVLIEVVERREQVTSEKTRRSSIASKPVGGMMSSLCASSTVTTASETRDLYRGSVGLVPTMGALHAGHAAEVGVTSALAERLTGGRYVDVDIRRADAARKAEAARGSGKPAEFKPMAYEIGSKDDPDTRSERCDTC